MVYGVQDIQQMLASGTLSIYTEMFSYSGTRLIYHGWAEPNTATSAAGWKICKYTYNDSGMITSIKFASGTRSFDKVWDSRADYVYS